MESMEPMDVEYETNTKSGISISNDTLEEIGIILSKGKEEY